MSKQFVKGGLIKAADIKQLYGSHRKLNNVRGGPGVKIRNVPSGIYISVAPGANKGIARYKVHTLPDEVGGVVPGWAKCHSWDGTTEGSSDVSVALVYPHSIGDEFYAILSTTDLVDNGIPNPNPINWLEVGTYPTFWNCKLTRDDTGATPVKAPTYSCTNLDGTVVVGSGMVPKMPRLFDAYVTVAENGYGWWDSEGDFVLQCTDETYQVSGCS